jgi:HK97 family phage portal protein
MLKKDFWKFFQIWKKKISPALFGVQQHSLQTGIFDHKGDKNEMLRHYSSWVYACVSIRAKAVAHAVFSLYSKHPVNHLKKIHTHPLLELLDEMNPFETRSEIVHRTVLHLDLCGDAYWYVPRNRLGVPAEIWILPPEKMKIIPDAKNVIAAYELSGAETPVRFAPDEIIHFKYPNPHDFFYGASPLLAAALSVDIDTFQHTYQRNFYRNSATPPVVLKTEQRLDETIYKRLKADWERRYKGPDNYGKMVILESGLTIEKVGINPRELDWLASNKMTRDNILAIFGVPASKLGIVEDVNRSTAESNDYTFAVNVVEPILTLLDERLTQDMARKFDPSLIIRHESSVPADMERKARIAEIRLRSGMTSINEERLSESLPPLTGGEEPLVRNNVIPLSSANKH